MKRPASAAPSSSDRAQAPTSCSSSERGAAALRSFFSSAAASNAGSAAQPAAASSRGSTAASSNPRSAERPADASAGSSSAEQPLIPPGCAGRSGSPSHLKISSIRDLQGWLAQEPMKSCRSSDAERIRQLAAVLLRPKPRQQDLRPFHSEWQVSRWQDGCKKRSDKQPRLLPEVIREFQDKIIKAAEKLQQQLSDGAEQPTSTAVEQSARMDTTDGVDSDDNPMVTRLQARQRKRGLDSAAENQRPLAKPKATDAGTPWAVVLNGLLAEQPE